MKKFLSLVLALVMTMSLVTISAGAADFADDSNIDYKEAVDVISAIGIVDGYANGSFGPDAVLTRGAAAKIICNLVLGPTTASALSATTAPFRDVPVTNTFAGYITYCAQQGIISGYGDGTFRPSGTLTGNAFLKMLLGALGYDSSKEGYTGSNWQINVIKQAVNIGLDDGNDNFVGSQAVTRQEAALYAFNMLQADLVEYPNDTIITAGDVTVTTQGSYSSVQWGSSADADGNIDGETGGDNYVQFAERYFNRLVKNVATDELGRPATTWTWRGEKVGTYAKTADATYSTNVRVYEIYNDLGMSTRDDDADLYINGNLVMDGTLNVARSNNDKLNDYDVNDRIGDGTVIEAFLDTNNNHVTVCAISVYGGKIASVEEGTARKDAYVILEEGSNYPAAMDSSANREFETTDFAEDDVVAYTYSDTEDCIVDMYALESVEGTLSKRVVTKSLTLGDTTYEYSKEYNFETGLSESSLSNGSEYVVYLDSNGYALWIEETTFSPDAYALVLNITNAGGTWHDDDEARLLFSDGSAKTVSLDKDYVTGSLVDTWDIVRYRANENGTYKLSSVATTPVTGFGVSSNNMTGTDIGSIDADSRTLFVVRESDGDTNVYTGIRTAPTISGATAYIYEKDNVAKVVFSIGGTVTNTSSDVIFLAGESVSGKVTSSDTADYYVYNAVVAGEITTVMVKDGVTLNASTGNVLAGTKGNIILNTVTYDVDDIMETGNFTGDSDLSVNMRTGIKKISSDEIRLGGAILAVSRNVNVYLVDTSGEIEEVTITDVNTDSDDEAYYTMEDGEITNLFVVEVD